MEKVYSFALSEIYRNPLLSITGVEVYSASLYFKLQYTNCSHLSMGGVLDSDFEDACEALASAHFPLHCNCGLSLFSQSCSIKLSMSSAYQP